MQKDLPNASMTDAESRDFYCEVIMDEASEDEYDGPEAAEAAESAGVRQ